MKLSYMRYVALALLIIATTISGGCNRNAAGSHPAPLLPTTPEDRFARIMDSFRRKVEDQPVGFVITQGNSRSTMFGTNKVSSQIIKPTTSDGHYKAIVTIQSESHYSLHRTKSSEDKDSEQQSKSKKTNAAADPNDKDNVAVVDPELAKSVRSEKNPVTADQKSSDEDIVTRRPEQYVRKYELTYDGDKWILLTSLDPKTEQAIQFAFDEALKVQ